MNAAIIIGSLFVALGAVLAHRWHDDSSWKRIFFFVAGTVVAVLGGLAATYGWNERTGDLQRANVANALDEEISENLRILSDKTFRPDEHELQQAVVFHELRDTALSTAVASGLFASDKNSAFFKQATRVRQMISSFNRRLNYAERAMVSGSEMIPRYRREIRDTLRPQIESELLLLRTLLRMSHTTALEQRGGEER